MATKDIAKRKPPLYLITLTNDHRVEDSWVWKRFMELAARPRRKTPYSDFAEGDAVTRAGDDVHLVKNMDEDGYCADFECVMAPADGWCKVGDVETNLCRRYSRLHPVDALKAVAAVEGITIDPEQEAKLRAMCDEPIDPNGTP